MMARFTIQKACTYFNKVFGLDAMLRQLDDRREWYLYNMHEVSTLLLAMFLLQFPSLHSFLSKREGQQKRLRNLMGRARSRKVPTVDVLIGVAAALSVDSIKEIMFEVWRKLKRNKVFERNKIDGRKVVAIDGIETTSSYKKHCEKCLSRTHSNGKTEYFHRHVCVLYLGENAHFFLNSTMLLPRDGSAKQEGELTGGKRLIEETARLLPGFADIVVADALYFNAPFLNLIRENGMHAVIRMEDETRKPYKEAQQILRNGHYHRRTFKATNSAGHPIEVTVNDLGRIAMAGYCEETVHVYQFIEHDLLDSNAEDRAFFVCCTSDEVPAVTVWRIAHARWGIENNGFHQLSVAYHAKHLYCHEAVEQLFVLMLLAFNLRECYLFCLRGRDFPKCGLTRNDITEEFRDSILLEVLRIPICGRCIPS